MSDDEVVVWRHGEVCGKVVDVTVDGDGTTRWVCPDHGMVGVLLNEGALDIGIVLSRADSAVEQLHRGCGRTLIDENEILYSCGTLGADPCDECVQRYLTAIGYEEANE